MPRYTGGGTGGGSSPVTSVFGRIGAVAAALNDYAASLVQNNSSVTGATVKDALNALLAAIPSVPVSSVFGRTGAVLAALDDYAASLVNNDSSVSGATVKDALNALLSAIPSVPVSSVFGRTGAVVATLNDYAASLVQNNSSVTGATVKDALNALLAAIPSITVFNANWGSVGASGTSVARWFGRGGTISGATAAPNGDYPIGSTGTFTFTLTARVSGTKLSTDSVTLTVYKNSVATGLTLTLTPSDTFKQASLAIACSAGDGISVQVVQTAAEAQAAWNCNVGLRATT